MTISVRVSFSNSKDERLSRIDFPIRQFFSANAEPYKTPNQYLRTMARKMAEKSLETNSEHIGQLLSWLENSNISIDDIDEYIFDNYIDSLCAYRTPSGNPLRWNTVAARIAGAYRLLLWAYRRGLFVNLRIEEVDQFRATGKQRYKTKGHPSKPIKEPVEFLSINQAIDFITALSETVHPNRQDLRRRNKLIGAFLLETGLRISELCNFPIRDLPEVNKFGPSTPARIIGKGNKARVILIPNYVLFQLWEYVDIDRQNIVESMSIRESKRADDTLFIGCYGQRLKPNSVQKLFRVASAKIDIRAHPHLLRHTFATYHYLTHKDLTCLANLLGHESEQTTREYYVYAATLVAYTGNYEGFQYEIDKLIGLENEEE